MHHSRFSRRKLNFLVPAFASVFVFCVGSSAKPLPMPWESGEFILALAEPVADADFDFSGQASPQGCSGSVVSFGQSDTSKAVMLTNAHCVGMLSVSQDTIFRNKPYATNVRLYQDRTRSFNVRSTQILYGVIRGNDLALVELNTTYRELAAKGVRSRKIAEQPVAVGSVVIMPSGYFRNVTQCPILGIIPSIREDVYQNNNSYKYRDCNSIHGTSGSPLIDAITGEVVGLNYTGNDDGEVCTYNNPCEVDQNGVVTAEKGSSYGDPVHAIMGCVNANKEFDLSQPLCSLPR